MSCSQGRDIRFGNIGQLGKFTAQIVYRRLPVTVVQPIDQTQGPHILGAQGFLIGNAVFLDRFRCQLGNIHGQNLETIQAAICQGIGVKAGLFQVPRREGTGIDDHGTASFHFAQIDLQGGGIHGHQDIRNVAGGGYLAGAKINLEGGHPEGGTDGCSDLRRKIREGRQVVSGHGGRQGELAAG